jgi:hypothetical protein
MNVDHLHELARLFMSQFSFKQLSLDEYLLEYNEELTDDERNLGVLHLSIVRRIKQCDVSLLFT